MTVNDKGVVSLADQAYDRIEEMIVKLELAPGLVFSESELSSRLDMGRTPLREALQRLAGENLIQILPRRGMMVAPVHLTDQLALLETRRVLDRLIASRAARLVSPEQSELLRSKADAMITAAEADQISEFMRLDRECDEILAAAARNAYATNAASTLHAHCRRFWYLYKNKGDLRESALRHAELMHAVADGDSERAEQASDRLLDYLVTFTRLPFDDY